MADVTPDTQQPQVQFEIRKIFSKDISFESPNAPELFKAEWKPEANVELNTNATKLEDNTYEVELSLTITTKSADKVAFLVEVKQSGIFSINGMDENEMGPILGSYCPNILFPYARETITSIISRGGFPELNLAPINFDAIYAQKMQEQQGLKDKQPQAEESKK